jgi:DNA-binding transcriptional LysR family regulator
MNVRLDSYKVFLEVCERGSFSKAAEYLYMTQPAVSQTISQLEKTLQIRLFTRISKGVVPTDEGLMLLEYVRSAINLLKTGEKKIFETKNLEKGTLKIGVGDTISKYVLMPHLEYFHKIAPNIQIKVINRTSIEVLDMLKTGDLDIALCNLPLIDSSIEVLPCFSVHDIFVCGDNYKDFFDNKKIKLKDLKEFPLILLEPKSNSRRYVQKFLEQNGINIEPEIELGSHDLLLDFAKIGLGIACVIEEFSKDFLNDKKVFKIRLDKEVPSRGIGFCFLKDVSLSPASTKLVEIVMNSKGE